MERSTRAVLFVIIHENIDHYPWKLARGLRAPAIGGVSVSLPKSRAPRSAYLARYQCYVLLLRFRCRLVLLQNFLQLITQQILKVLDRVVHKTSLPPRIEFKLVGIPRE
jgi:hypothetical protein